MRICDKQTQDKQAAFESDVQNEGYDFEDAEETNFVRKLLKSKGKKSGKLPFKCFRCNGIGHLATKCPMRDNDDDEDEYDVPVRHKNTSKTQRFKRRNYVEESDDGDSDECELAQGKGKDLLLFMAVQESNNNASNAEDTEGQAEYDFEGELTTALEVLDEEVRKRKFFQKENKELKSKLSSLTSALSETEKALEEVEAKLSSTRAEKDELNNKMGTMRGTVASLEKKLKQFEKIGSSVEALNELIDSQRGNTSRKGLGFVQEQNDKSNKGKAPMIDQDTSTSKQPRRQPEKPMHAKQSSVKSTPRKFPGYCFSCNKYGHMARMCHSRNARRSHPNFASENPFSTLNSQVECYNCGDWGHIARECRLNNRYKPKFQRRQSREDLYCENCGLNGHDKASCRAVDLNALILKKLQEHFDKIGDSGEKTVNKQRSKQEWRRKDYIQQSSHVVQTTVKAPSQKRSWILDSGCSSHMTGDISDFSKLAKYDGGNVRFGNNGRAKISGKGVVKMARGNVSDVLYVEGLQHSLLSVSQICSKGHEVTFKTDGVDIRRVSDGKIMASGVRTSGDYYTLSDDVDESCLVSQNEELLEDIFTKPLPRESYEYLRTTFGVKCIGN